LACTNATPDAKSIDWDLRIHLTILQITLGLDHFMIRPLFSVMLKLQAFMMTVLFAGIKMQLYQSSFVAA
jgi:hypothetical protein